MNLNEEETKIINSESQEENKEEVKQKYLPEIDDDAPGFTVKIGDNESSFDVKKELEKHELRPRRRMKMKALAVAAGENDDGIIVFVRTDRCQNETKISSDEATEGRGINSPLSIYAKGIFNQNLLNKRSGKGRTVILQP